MGFCNMVRSAFSFAHDRLLAIVFIVFMVIVNASGFDRGASAQSGAVDDDASQQHLRTTARHELKVTSAARLSMKRMLQERAAEEASADRRPLVGRKLAVDSALVPAILLLELSLGHPQEPLAPLRFDYRGSALRVLAPKGEAGTSIDALGAAWSEAAASACCFSYRSERLGAVGEDFPSLIHWQGWILRDSLSLRAHWFEPFLAQRRLDFPLNPENLRIDFTPQRATVTSMIPGEMTRTEHFSPQSPRLVNPSDIYDLFDFLRVAAHVLSHRGVREASPTWDTVLVRNDAPANQEQHFRIRSVAWELAASQVARCTIWQPVILLAYETAHRLVGEARVGGSVVGSAEVIPDGEIEWFSHGLEAVIDFRPLDPSRDRMEVPIEGASALALPAVVSLHTDAALVAQSHFGPMLIGPTAARVFESMDSHWPLVIEAVARRDSIMSASPDRLAAGEQPPFPESAILGDTDPLVARWRLRANLMRAVQLNDAEAHDRAIATMSARLSQDGVDARWAVMNAQAWIEELAGPLDRPQAAMELAVPAWLTLASQLAPEEAISEMTRLIVGGRWGLALLLSRSLKDVRLPPGASNWLARVQPRLEGWARGDDTAPTRSGPHPDWDARVDQTVIEIINSGVTP